jgi:hypothetical protein
MHLPTSQITRITLGDTVLLVDGGLDGRSPLFVPKGQSIEVNLYTLQRDSKIWGNDTETFSPLVNLRILLTANSDRAGEHRQ